MAMQESILKQTIIGLLSKNVSVVEIDENTGEVSYSTVVIQPNQVFLDVLASIIQHIQQFAEITGVLNHSATGSGIGFGGGIPGPVSNTFWSGNGPASMPPGSIK